MQQPGITLVPGIARRWVLIEKIIAETLLVEDMILLTLMIVMVTGLIMLFRHYTSAKYRTAPLKIKSKAIEKIISAESSELTLETAMRKCPLFNFYPGESVERILGSWGRALYRDGETITTPGFILQGEVEIVYKGDLVCVKQKGALLSGSMELLSSVRTGVKRARGSVEILLIDVSKARSRLLYVLFSMFRKACSEIVCKYFELENVFIERETMRGGHDGGDNLDAFVSLLGERLSLNLSPEGVEMLKSGIEARFAKEDEVLKDEDKMLDYVLYVSEGEVLVSSCGHTFSFAQGSGFGYFSLFFDAYSLARVSAKSDTWVLICKYSVLAKMGLNETSFDYSMLEGIDEIVHIVDEAAEWMRLSPGDTVAQKGDSVREVFYVSAGNLRTASREFLSGTAIGGKECIVGECWDETVVATKMTDIVKIPGLLLDHVFGREKTFFKKYTKRLFDGRKKKNGKIVSIVPTGKYNDIATFSRRLKAAIGPSSLLLSRRDVVDVLARKAFDTTEELRFMDHLIMMSKQHEIILICVENGYSRLLRYLLNFSDVLLLVGTSFVDVPEYNVYCSVEFVKIYEERRVFRGSTKVDRRRPRVYSRGVPSRKGETIEYDRIHHVLSPSRTALLCSRDFQRLGRSLRGKRIGLVLSGGGARGLAHVGVIQALEEEGIPIDCIGGTSMGAFIGAMYAKECNNYYVFKQAKKFSNKMSNLWLLLLDLTYPICSMFSGYGFNNSLYSVFKDDLIQDLWLEYFCVTTNLATYEEEVHRNGVVWRYVRASMGICGYLPPICDNKRLLVDGGYTNNVPADVMMNMQVEKIITVDVGTTLENDYFDYGDALSGFTVLFNRFFGNKKFATMEDIQYRLAYISTERKMRELDNNEDIVMLRPDLGKYRTMDFKRFDEIVACGYQSAKRAISEWRRDRRFSEFFSGLVRTAPKRRHSV